MATRQSHNIVTHGAVPDPRQESVHAQFDVRLARELRSLLKTELEGPDDSSVALGARTLTDIFARTLPTQPLSLSAARSVGCIEVDGFTAWPIFITYGGGHRDPYAPVYNNAQIEKRLEEFYTSGASKIRGGIGEAIRNVGQHGHEHVSVGYHQCVFAPAAVLVKEVDLGSGVGPPRRVLMAVVADEGSGISHPERSILNGIGSMSGVDALGMGIEMQNCLSYLVKSNRGEWCLFDGANQSNPDKYDKSGGFKTRSIGEKETIGRVATLNLPAPAKGCQKVMFFAHPNSTGEDVKHVHDLLFSALEGMSR